MKNQSKNEGYTKQNNIEQNKIIKTIQTQEEA